MNAPSRPSRIQGLGAVLRWPGAGRAVVGTAGYNVALIGGLGLGGVVLARALGPTVRGEYAAVTAWLDVAVVVGQCGQPAALCFYVARDPLRARQYVATSRAIMIAACALILPTGLLFDSALAHGSSDVKVGYQIALCACMAAVIGASYVSPLQARDLHRWNVVRLGQPALSLLAISALWFLRLLTLRSALMVLLLTLLMQLALAYISCTSRGLAPGHPQRDLFRPLVTYGLAQLLALAPATLNAQLGQLVLSQTVSAAELGRYAVALSLTLLPMPLVAAVGNVAFPRLAAVGAVTEANLRLLMLVIVGSAGMAAGILLPVGAVAYWAIPRILGAGYQGAVPLLWVLIPGAIFSACGQVVADLLRGTNHLGVVALAQGLAVLFLVAILVALLPVAGVMGAAIASTVSYGVAFAGMLSYLWRLARHTREGS